MNSSTAWMLSKTAATVVGVLTPSIAVSKSGSLLRDQWAVGFRFLEGR
jgi:hypothetical protein